MSDIEEERVVAAHHRLGHDSRRRGDWIRTAVLLLIVAWIIFREFQLAGAAEEETQSRATAVSLAAQVQAECDDPAIGVDLAICQKAEDIIEDPENESIITGAPGEDGQDGKDGRPGRDAPPPDPGLLRQFVDEWLAANTPPILQGPPGEDGQDGEDGEDGTDGADGASGPACPNGATPIRWHFPGTANIDLPEGTYLICPAG